MIPPRFIYHIIQCLERKTCQVLNFSSTTSLCAELREWYQNLKLKCIISCPDAKHLIPITIVHPIITLSNSVNHNTNSETLCNQSICYRKPFFHDHRVTMLITFSICRPLNLILWDGSKKRNWVQVQNSAEHYIVL